jgi:hypothetical protein
MLLQLIALSSFQAVTHDDPVVLFPLRDTYQVGDVGVTLSATTAVGVSVAADVAVEVLVDVDVGVRVGVDVDARVKVGELVTLSVTAAVGVITRDDVDVGVITASDEVGVVVTLGRADLRIRWIRTWPAVRTLP